MITLVALLFIGYQLCAAQDYRLRSQPEFLDDRDIDHPESGVVSGNRHFGHRRTAKYPKSILEAIVPVQNPTLQHAEASVAGRIGLAADQRLCPPDIRNFPDQLLVCV